MKSFTFDTNCLIDIEQNREPARFILKLIDAHRRGDASVAFVAVSASERQKGDRLLPNYDCFTRLLKKLQVADIPQIKGFAVCGVSYWDQAVWANDAMVERDKEIHNFLFPSHPYSYKEFAKIENLEEGDLTSKTALKWRNRWCDRQMIWAHDYEKRDVFVTSDANFPKLEGKVGFESIIVKTPGDAVKML